MTKQKLKSQETKERIFQAAKTILQRSGYESLSIKNICEEAGVSNGSFYHHFKTKDDLLSYYIEAQPSINPECLDIPKDKRSEYLFERREAEPNGISFADAVDREYELKRVPLQLTYQGCTTLPFESRYGVLFVDKRYLIPFGDGVTLWERFYPDSKRSYIAVKRGMLLEGIILPEDMASAQLADMLVNIGEAIAEVAAEKEKAEPKQQRLDV